jgi:uncharacterized RmlC-like cupin family protein
MSNQAGSIPCVVHGATGPTGQTPGMERKAAIDANSVGAQRVFMGRASAPPLSNSGAHHHGESETAAYIVRGVVRVYFGAGFREFVEARGGDFLFVPANMPHVEVNPSPDEPMEAILARGPDNTVVNLPDPVEHLTPVALEGAGTG